MRKEIYLIRGLRDETYDGFRMRIMTLAEQAVASADPAKLKFVLTIQPPPKISIIPFKKKKVAAISVFRAADQPLKSLTEESGFEGVYRVDEAIPVRYEKDWQNGEQTPGICLFTLFRQKPNIPYETFLDRWHNSHTPLSLKIHPLWNYNRNVVEEKLLDHSFDWHGIVEEQFRTTADLLHPIKFFGHPLIMPYRMWQVYWDTQSFLEYKSIEPYFAHEFHIKS